jgi:carbonic anhydrase/acetyltransferase-like protein (isoleucine patch superfamily)
MIDLSQRYPEQHPQTFVADGARLIGRVILEEGASIWYNCVLRADIEDIIIGPNTNVQDNSVIHVDIDKKTVIGRGVTIGHGVILHACTVGDNCIVGMGSILLDDCIIPRNSIVAAGSLVPPRKTFPEGSLILGSPAKVVRNLTEEEIRRNEESAIHYRWLWEAYPKFGIGGVPK